MKLINWDLIASPFNWFAILTMILFSLFLMAMLSRQGE